jgi:hypothetical protein
VPFALSVYQSAPSGSDVIEMGLFIGRAMGYWLTASAVVIRLILLAQPSPSHSALSAATVIEEGSL